MSSAVSQRKAASAFAHAAPVAAQVDAHVVLLIVLTSFRTAARAHAASERDGSRLVNISNVEAKQAHFFDPKMFTHFEISFIQARPKL